MKESKGEKILNMAVFNGSAEILDHYLRVQREDYTYDKCTLTAMSSTRRPNSELFLAGLGHNFRASESGALDRFVSFPLY